MGLTPVIWSGSVLLQERCLIITRLLWKNMLLWASLPVWAQSSALKFPIIPSLSSLSRPCVHLYPSPRLSSTTPCLCCAFCCPQAKVVVFRVMWDKPISVLLKLLISSLAVIKWEARNYRWAMCYIHKGHCFFCIVLGSVSLGDAVCQALGLSFSTLPVTTALQALIHAPHSVLWDGSLQSSPGCFRCPVSDAAQQ